MSKGLEALSNIKHNYELLLRTNKYIINKDLTEIEEALFQAVEEDLSVLELFKQAVVIEKVSESVEFSLDDDIATMTQKLYKISQQELNQKLRQEFKSWVINNFFSEETEVLNLIRSKTVDLFEIKRNDTCEAYNAEAGLKERFLTEQEFELLKEWIRK